MSREAVDPVARLLALERVVGEHLASLPGLELTEEQERELAALFDTA